MHTHFFRYLYAKRRVSGVLPVIMIMSRYLCVFYKPLNSDVDYRHVIFDMLTCCVLKILLRKATSGELLRDGVESIWAFSSAYIYRLELN